MALGKNIRSLRSDMGLTLEKLSELSGVDVGTISALEMRDSSMSKYAAHIARGLGVPLNDLLSDKQITIPAQPAPLPAVVLPDRDYGKPEDIYITFEVLNVQAAAGSGLYTSYYPEIINYVHVLKSWAQANLSNDLSHIRMITARGMSMHPTIENGDVLFIDTRIQHYDGDGIYVISREGAVQVKRLQLLHGGVLSIISDNKSYEPEKIAGDEINAIIINGRVLAGWSLNKFW